MSDSKKAAGHVEDKTKGTFVGTDPIYENAAHVGEAPFHRGDGGPTDVQKRVLEHEEMNREQSVRKNWRGEVVSEEEAKRTAATVTQAAGAVKGEPAKDGDGGDGDDEPTKDELMEEAKRLDVQGRSTMDKSELEKAVAKAQAQPPQSGQS